MFSVLYSLTANTIISCLTGKVESRDAFEQLSDEPGVSPWNVALLYHCVAFSLKLKLVALSH